MATVLLALREPLARLGARAALEAVPGIRAAEVAASQAAILDAVSRLRPELLLVDSAIVKEDPDFVPRALRLHPACRAVVMVEHDDDECLLRSLALEPKRWQLSEDALQRLNECCLVGLRASARGCVPRSATPERLVATVQAVLEGEVAAGPWLAARWRETLAGNGAVQRGERVTARELEVVELVADGLSNKAIAKRLGIREQTVKNHLSRVMRKMGVESRLELALLAVRHHLVQP